MALLLFLARVIIRALQLLPQRLLNGLARILGALTHRLPWHKHAIIRCNLELCFPELDDAARHALHRRYLYELFRLIFEAPVLWHWSERRIRDAIDIEKGATLARPDPNATVGTLYVSGHFGNWELLNLSLSLDQPITTLYRAPGNPRLDRFINQPRSRFGAHMVPGDRAALKHLLTALRRGEAASIAADIQPKGGDGLFAPFFGIETLTMTLVHKLARKTGCRVVFTDLRRKPEGGRWTQTLTDVTSQMDTDDAAQALAVMNRWLEGRIRAAPAQYLWLYKRFSKRPEGEARPYPRVSSRSSSMRLSSSG
jgi:KDO2-lipid IV(A) lauroyltransferase